MYRPLDIKAALFGLVGWRSSDDVAITQELTQSTTGVYFNGEHPMLTLRNLKSIAPESVTKTYPFYESGKNYVIGDKVNFSDKNYIAIKAGAGFNPSNAEYWKEYDPFSEWLKAKTEDGIIKAIQRFYTDKMGNGSAKGILENKALFDGAGRLTDTLTPTGGVVGFEIVPARYAGVTVSMSAIGLQFTGNCDITINLFHSSKKEPIQSKTIQYTGGGNVQWIPLTDWLLPYVSANTDAGGSWYICYDETKLPDGIKAIVKSKDWSKAPCSTCSRTELANWTSITKYLEVHPFRSKPNGDLLFDVEDNVYTYETNYGLNLRVSVYCDITDTITLNKYAFQDVIAKQVAVMMLREMAYNPNANIDRFTNNASRQELLYEIDGDSQGKKEGGLKVELDRAFKALDVDLKGIDKACLPCSNRGVRYRTV